MKHGGDDLEDDFIPDDIVALSGDEAPGDAQLDDEDIFVDDDGQTPEEEDDTDEVGARGSHISVHRSDRFCEEA
jgi:protein CMS1